MLLATLHGLLPHSDILLGFLSILVPDQGSAVECTVQPFSWHCLNTEGVVVPFPIWRLPFDLYAAGAKDLTNPRHTTDTCCSRRVGGNRNLD